LSKKKKVLTTEEFVNMTEEEKIEWAKNYKRTTTKRTSLIGEAQLKAERLKTLYTDREKKRRRYVRNPDAVWTEVQKEKRRLLRKYNTTIREQRAYDAAMADYRKRFKEDDSWLERYRRVYKPNITKYAQTYVMPNRYESYQLGFSLNELIKLMPVSKVIVSRLLDNDIIPPPIASGYLLKKTKVSEVETPYYTLNEAIIILDTWQSYWKKARVINTDDKEMWLKKKFWQKLVDYRNEQETTNH
jgi:hypothetical protein